MTVKMIIFSSKDCPTCIHLEKNVLPAFTKAHPDLVIEKVQVGLDEDSPGTPESEARADAYEVEGLPTIIIEGEIARGGATVCSLPALNKFLKEAQGHVAKSRKRG